MIDWFKMFGSNFFEGVSEASIESILKEVQHRLKGDLCVGGVWLANYKRIRVVAMKECLFQTWLRCFLFTSCQVLQPASPRVKSTSAKRLPITSFTPASPAMANP